MRHLKLFEDYDSYITKGHWLIPTLRKNIQKDFDFIKDEIEQLDFNSKYEEINKEFLTKIKKFVNKNYSLTSSNNFLFEKEKELLDILETKINLYLAK